jgi:hypothetical protein
VGGGPPRADLDDTWELRGVSHQGGKTQDIPIPAAIVRFLRVYVDRALAPECEVLTPDTPLFWSVWGTRTIGHTRAPMTPKSIWSLCKTYGRLIGYPELKPHDLRHGVAVEVLEQGSWRSSVSECRPPRSGYSWAATGSGRPRARVESAGRCSSGSRPRASSRVTSLPSRRCG